MKRDWRYARFRAVIFFKVIFLITMYALGLWGVYRFFLKGFIAVNVGETESVALTLSLITFLGGLFGGVLLETVKKMLGSPCVVIDAGISDEVLKYLNGDISFRARVKNLAKSVLAQKCQVKISIDFNEDDRETTEFTSEECKLNWGTDLPFLMKEPVTIQDESLLWDIQPNGERVLELDIPSGCSYLITVAKYRARGIFFEIPSENTLKPRIWLKAARDFRDKKSVKNYQIKIAVYGGNFPPVSKEIKLQFNDWDPVRSMDLAMLKTTMRVQDMAFPAR